MDSSSYHFLHVYTGELLEPLGLFFFHPAQLLAGFEQEDRRCHQIHFWWMLFAARPLGLQAQQFCRISHTGCSNWNLSFSDWKNGKFLSQKKAIKRKNGRKTGAISGFGSLRVHPSVDQCYWVVKLDQRIHVEVQRSKPVTSEKKLHEVILGAESLAKFIPFKVVGKMCFRTSGEFWVLEGVLSWLFTTRLFEESKGDPVVFHVLQATCLQCQSHS